MRCDAIRASGAAPRDTPSREGQPVSAPPRRTSRGSRSSGPRPTPGPPGQSPGPPPQAPVCAAVKDRVLAVRGLPSSPGPPLCRALDFAPGQSADCRQPTFPTSFIGPLLSPSCSLPTESRPRVLLNRGSHSVLRSARIRATPTEWEFPAQTPAPTELRASCAWSERPFHPVSARSWIEDPKRPRATAPPLKSTCSAARAVADAGIAALQRTRTSRGRTAALALPLSSRNPRHPSGGSACEAHVQLRVSTYGGAESLAP